MIASTGTATVITAEGRVVLEVATDEGTLALILRAGQATKIAEDLANAALDIAWSGD